MKRKYLVFFIIFLISIFSGCTGEKTEGQVSTQETSKVEKIDAAKIYATNCAGCHGPKGKGDGPMASNLPEPPKDLTATRGKSDAELDDIISAGEEAKGMPGFEGSLSEEEILKVVEYLRTL